MEYRTDVWNIYIYIYIWNIHIYSCEPRNCNSSNKLLKKTVFSCFLSGLELSFFSPKSKQILTPRSRCPSLGRPWDPPALLPALSLSRPLLSLLCCSLPSLLSLPSQSLSLSPIVLFCSSLSLSPFLSKAAFWMRRLEKQL